MLGACLVVPAHDSCVTAVREDLVKFTKCFIGVFLCVFGWCCLPVVWGWLFVFFNEGEVRLKQTKKYL